MTIFDEPRPNNFETASSFFGLVTHKQAGDDRIQSMIDEDYETRAKRWGLLLASRLLEVNTSFPDKPFNATFVLESIFHVKAHEVFCDELGIPGIPLSDELPKIKGLSVVLKREAIYIENTVHTVNYSTQQV